MAYDYSEVASEVALKALYIFFIVVTSMANVGLLVKLSRAAGGFRYLRTGSRKFRCIILTSLTVGDMLAYIFGLTVLVGALFEWGRMPTSAAYNLVFHITPCVYAAGLVILCFESIYYTRRDLHTLERRIELSRVLSFFNDLAIGVFPWTLGMAVALPATCAHYHYNRDVLLAYVTGIVPVVLVLLLAVFVGTRFSNNLCRHVLSVQAEESTNEHDIHVDNSPHGHPPCHLPSCDESLEQSLASTSQSQPLLTSPQHPMPNVNPAFGHQQQICNTSHSLGHVANSENPAFSGNQNSQNRPSDLDRIFNVAKEKRAHAIVAIFYTLCCLPFPFIILLYKYAHIGGSTSGRIIWDVTFALVSMRAFVMPHAWMLTGSIRGR